MIAAQTEKRLGLARYYLAVSTMPELKVMLVNLTKDHTELADIMPAETTEYLNNEIAACKAAIILLGGTL